MNPLNSSHPILMTESVYHNAFLSVGSLPAERGAILGSSDNGKTIDHFYWDKQAATSSTTYSPYAELINNEILPKWNKNGVRLCGFIHSHPRGFGHPSSGDAFYAQNLLSALGEERFSLPIVQSAVSGRFEIIGFVAEARENRLPAIIHYPIIIKGEEVSA